MTDDRPFCTSCGARRTPGAAFCTSCGAAAAPAGAGAAAPATDPADPVAQATQVQPAVPAAPGWDRHDQLPAETAASEPGHPTAYDAGYQWVYEQPQGHALDARQAQAWPGTAPRRRTGRVLAVIALVLLVAGASGGAAWWFLAGDDEPALAVDRPAPVSTTTGTPPSSPETSATSSSSPDASEPTTSASASATTAARVLTCWDGAAATSQADCGEPEGLAGLQWLFRGLDATSCVQTSATAERTVYNCGVDPVKINVSHWRDHASALSYYEGNTGGTAASLGDGRLVVEGSSPRSGEFKTAVLYDGERWGATLYSYDSSALPPAIAGLQMRPGRQYAGR